MNQELLPESINYAVKKASNAVMTAHDIVSLQSIAQPYGYNLRDFLKFHHKTTQDFNQAKERLQDNWDKGDWDEHDLSDFILDIHEYRFLATTVNVQWLHTMMQEDIEHRYANKTLVNFHLKPIKQLMETHAYLETTDNLVWLNDYMIITSTDEKTVNKWRGNILMRTGENIDNNVSDARSDYKRIKAPMIQPLSVITR